MKRTLSILLVLVMMLSVFAGCGTTDLSGTIKDPTDENAVASVSLAGGEPTYYATFSEAWKAANYATSEAVLTLLADVTAVDGKFGDYEILSVGYSNEPLTIDMNGHTIDKALEEAQRGGHVFGLFYSCDVTIKNGTITGANNVGAAGCIYVASEDANLKLEGVTITGNKAGSEGGGLYIDKANNVVLTNCNFYGNTAASYGGAICIEKGTSNVSLTNVKLYDNIANFGGGAIFVYGGESVLSMNNVSITENASDLGGGFYWSDRSGDGKMASVVMSGDIVIRDNDAGGVTDNLLITPFPNKESKLTADQLSANSEIYVSFESQQEGVLAANVPAATDDTPIFHADTEYNEISLSNGTVSLVHSKK